jgi:lipopolysaccharide export system permease protein
MNNPGQSLGSKRADAAVGYLTPLFPPVISRHLLGTFLRTAVLCLVTFLAIALIVDFFDQFDGFLHHKASAAPIARYFLFKVPLFVTQLTPIALLAGVLLGLGGLGRHNEFVALRAAGVSIWQIAAPLLGVAVLISGLVLYWNERVVPYCAQRSHDIYAVEIRKNPLKEVAGRRHVWYRGLAGFYNIKHVNPRQRALVGLTVYQFGRSFRPRRVIQVDRATWDGERWVLTGAHAYRLGTDGTVESDSARDFYLPEQPQDFLAVHRDAEEFSFTGLRQHLRDLKRKGADIGEYLVDLHLKIAVPLASLLMVMIGIPLATRGTRTTNLAGAVAVGLAIGFSYWVVLAFARALGQGGALHPLIAAWTANGIFGLVGLFLVLGAE